MLLEEQPCNATRMLPTNEGTCNPRELFKGFAIGSGREPFLLGLGAKRFGVIGAGGVGLQSQWFHAVLLCLWSFVFSVFGEDLGEASCSGGSWGKQLLGFPKRGVGWVLSGWFLWFLCWLSVF